MVYSFTNRVCQRLRHRSSPCTVPPRTYRPSLRQDRTTPGYAIKALLARSVLAYGCAPHAASGVSLTAPGAVRPCLRGDRYTVSLQCHSVQHFFPGCSPAQATPSGPVPAPTPAPRLPGSGVHKHTRQPNLHIHRIVANPAAHLPSNSNGLPGQQHTAST